MEPMKNINWIFTLPQVVLQIKKILSYFLSMEVAGNGEIEKKMILQ
jgi:hypothetical protein